jgi:nucleotide sugar dehydrogenase
LAVNPPRAYGPGSTVAVVGLGKIGLPLAARFASRGMRVIGCDADPDVVEAVSAGRSHITGEPGLAELVAEAARAGRLRATADTATAVADADVVVVVVRLVVDDLGRTDFTSIDAATEDIGRGLQPATLVLYETTLPVGTVSGRIAARLASASGLVPGRDFHLAFSPERVSSGTVFRDLHRYPKVVGGLDEASGDAAVAFYRAALDLDPALGERAIVRVASADSAELVKLIETTYRDVNIALANEFALFADRWGIDVIEAIAAANTQPYSHVHQPGVGVGGHCIGVYPHFLLNDERAGDTLRLPRIGRQTNDAMAGHAVRLVQSALGSLHGRTVLVLGYAYRADVREDFGSAARRLVDEIAAAGGRPVVHDPLYTADELRERGVEPYDLASPSPVDAVMLQAYHAAYRGLAIESLPGCRVVLDGRNVLDRASIEAAGVRYVGLGRGVPAAVLV